MVLIVAYDSWLIVVSCATDLKRYCILSVVASHVPKYFVT